SVDLSLPEHHRGRAQEQAEVEAERPTPRVHDVEVECFAERGVRARLNLPKPREARWNEESLEMVGCIEFELVRNRGSGTDERHVSTEHVEDLRQLVEGGTAEPPGTRG